MPYLSHNDCINSCDICIKMQWPYYLNFLSSWFKITRFTKQYMHVMFLNNGKWFDVLIISKMRPKWKKVNLAAGLHSVRIIKLHNIFKLAYMIEIVSYIKGLFQNSVRDDHFLLACFLWICCQHFKLKTGTHKLNSQFLWI